MVKCSFCGKEQDDHKGVFLMKNDGTSSYFCSSKCRKNQLKLKRDKRKIRWTEAFHIFRAKKISKEKERFEKLKKEKAEEKAEKKEVKKVEKKVKSSEKK